MNQTSEEAPPKTDDKASGLFEEANARYDAGDYQRALELFEAALKAGLVNEVVFNNKGAALDALGRNEEAVACYKQAVSKNSSYELAWHNLGNSYYVLENYEKALWAYHRARKLNSARLENLSGLSASFVKLGRPKKAKSVIREMDSYAKDDKSVLVLQSDLYLDSSAPEDAVDCLRRYVDANPNELEGYARLGNAQHENGDYTKAVEAFEKALRLAPSDKEIWNNLGYTYFAAGYFDQSLEAFDKAIAVDPLYKHAWYNKGYAYHGADMLEQAVECYWKAIGIDSHDKVLWNNLGNALYNLGKYAESIPKFVEALGIDPDYEIAWNNIGNALEKMELYAAAIPFHDRSLEINPKFDYALYAKGVCKSHMGDLEGGFDLILESLDINPSYDEAWKARAVVAGQMGRWDEALMSIEEALSINPEFDEGWLERGEILMTVGDAEAAHASFEMALKCLENMRPDTNSGMFAMIRRGHALARLGRFDEALANIESVVMSRKMESKSLPELLRLRRLLNKWELPRAVREAAEAAKDNRVKVEYAKFLFDSGDIVNAERVLALSEDDGEPEVVMLRARMKAAHGNVKGAAEDAAKMSDVSESVAERFLGEAHEARADFRSAVKAYSRALEGNPSDLAAAISLARVRMRLGEAREALQAADTAIGIDPNEWEPHKIKADAYSFLGEHDRAKTEMQHALSLVSSSGMKPDDIIGGRAS